MSREGLRKAIEAAGVGADLLGRLAEGEYASRPWLKAGEVPRLLAEMGRTDVGLTVGRA